MFARAMNYPATTLATIVALVALGGAALLFISGDERAALLLAIIGPAVTTLLSTNRGEAATHAARRADEGVQLAKTTLDQAVADGAQTTPAALTALTTLLERTERKIDSVKTTVENGHGSEPHP